MNEKLNLVEILKDCPKGTKLYSPLVGEVEFEGIDADNNYPIDTLYDNGNSILSFTKEGLYYVNAVNAECLLFPSKDQRDWSKFKPKKPKFDPKILRPFDKVLQFDALDDAWTCDFYSHKNNKCDPGFYECLSVVSERVIPYNDDTKHLVGTAKEAPEYYRYWED